MPRIIDAEIILPIATIKDKGLIYGIYATEDQVNGVKNCATVSTVQKCFEEFKEE